MDYIRQQPKRVHLIVGTLVLICLFYFILAIRPPSDFPDPGVVVIEEGMSLSKAARVLKDAHMIRSEFWFVNFVILFKHERKVVQGEYYFEKPLGAFEIAERISGGNYNLGQLKTTIPEGSTISDIAMIIKRRYPLFDMIHFNTLARTKEGYLFPDTYHFGADARPEKIVDTMTATFNKKIADPELTKAIADFGKPLEDVIKMASILEGEARQTRTRQIVAGILWERMKIGIPLQVDASFRYVNGKTTQELTLSDLKIDSPYNTYLYKGLPPTPISNPGLDSIKAAVTPIPTDYLYFLTGDDGNMYYATTLEEHAANKRRYLSL